MSGVNGVSRKLALKMLAKRECGACQECCRYQPIPEFDKPAGVLCKNAAPEGGCGVYSVRPDFCRTFRCMWHVPGYLPREDERPDLLGVMFLHMRDREDGREFVMAFAKDRKVFETEGARRAVESLSRFYSIELVEQANAQVLTVG